MATLQSIVFPTKDLARAKAQLTALFGMEPEVDAPYYVGYKVDGRDVGLDPNGHHDGAVVYWQVEDIETSLKELVGSGVEVLQPVKDVGGGRLIASVRTADGNLIGLMQ